eukprot:GHVL01002303.1.p1 GENE.GHVL01002303.1~~GHVL01002303.1.p1  ORF type:complete len:470 (-),score=68.40 GHVL01002303.1:202-1611(-)
MDRPNKTNTNEKTTPLTVEDAFELENTFSANTNEKTTPPTVKDAFELENTFSANTNEKTTPPTVEDAFELENTLSSNVNEKTTPPTVEDAFELENTFNSNINRPQNMLAMNTQDHLSCEKINPKVITESVPILSLESLHTVQPFELPIKKIHVNSEKSLINDHSSVEKSNPKIITEIVPIRKIESSTTFIPIQNTKDIPKTIPDDENIQIINSQKKDSQYDSSVPENVPSPLVTCLKTFSIKKCKGRGFRDDSTRYNCLTNGVLDYSPEKEEIDDVKAAQCDISHKDVEQRIANSPSRSRSLVKNPRQHKQQCRSSSLSSTASSPGLSLKSIEKTLKKVIKKKMKKIRTEIIKNMRNMSMSPYRKKSRRRERNEKYRHRSHSSSRNYSFDRCRQYESSQSSDMYEKPRKRKDVTLSSSSPPLKSARIQHEHDERESDNSLSGEIITRPRRYGDKGDGKYETFILKAPTK